METKENKNYVIFQSGAHQYRASVGDTILVELLDIEEGAESCSFDKVLMLVNDEDVKVGQPTVEGATVQAKVLGTEKQKKLVSFKHKKRKTHRKKTGHRQKLTKIQIESIKA